MPSHAPAPGTPAVSVVIAVHNGLPYLEAAMRSIMAQTLNGIEIIAVDDASSDDSPAVLARLAAEDSRIRILTLETNRKLAGALNAGMELARAPYVARMDADDLCHPTRLEVQTRFMDAHPQVILCGTSVRYIDGEGQVLRTSRRVRDAVMCRWLMRSRLPILHPTFFFRRLPDGSLPHYDPAYPVAQDHDFATRILDHGDIVSLGDVLVDYRVHGASTTSAKWKTQQKLAHDTTRRLQAADLPDPIVRDLAEFDTVFFFQKLSDPALFFKGLRDMVAHDSRRHPAYAAWFRRQGAQLAFEGLKRAHLSRAAIARTFLRHGRDFVAPLGLRLLEIRGWLPGAMRSDPTSPAG